MKQKNEPISTTNLQNLLDKYFDKIENRLDLMDQKNYSAQGSIELRITSTSVDLRQRLERDFEAKLQLLEERLNKRITNVADLITIALGRKFQSLENRVAKVEKIQHFQTTV